MMLPGAGGAWETCSGYELALIMFLMDSLSESGSFVSERDLAMSKSINSSLLFSNYPLDEASMVG